MAWEPVAGRGARFSGKGAVPGMAYPGYGGQSMWDMGPTGPSAGSSAATMGGQYSGMYSSRGGQSMWDMGANGAQTAPSSGSGRSMWDQGPSEQSHSGERSRSMWDQGPKDGQGGMGSPQPAAGRPLGQTIAPPVRTVTPPAQTSPPVLNPANAKRGTVKSYSVVKGFGFILCPEIPQDIYFGRDSLQADLRTSDVAGTEVLFELIRAPDGKPQARTLKPIGPIPKPSGVQVPPGGAPAAASQAPPGAAAPAQQAHPGSAGGYGQGQALGGMMPGRGQFFFPGKGGCVGGCAPMMARPGYPMGPTMGHPPMGGPPGMAPHPGMWPGKGGPMPGQQFPLAAGRPGSMFPQPLGVRPGMPGAMGGPSLANPPPGGMVLGPMGRPMVPHNVMLPKFGQFNNPDRRRDWSPHAGSKAIRAAMIGERGAAAAAAEKKEDDAQSKGSRSVSSRSRSSSSSSRSRSRSRGRKKKKKKKRRRSESSTISSSSSSRASKKSRKKDKDASGSKKEEGDKGDDGKPADSPEIQKAKMEVLDQLKKLQGVEPKELRTKEFRALLRNWHPDKNPENVEVATAIFQFLQKGKALLNLR